MADTLTREAIAFGSQPLSPVPQYWTGTSYEKVQGANGSVRETPYNSSGTEIFTGTTPASVQLTATSTMVISGTSTTVISGTATVTFSGTETVVISGTSTVNYSGSATVEIVTSAGGTSYFSTSNPGGIRTIAPIAADTLYTATITWSAGTTATSVQTLNVGILTANFTTPTIEIVTTNDGPYAVTANAYKVISANGSSFTTSAITTFIAPAEIISAGVTINAGRSTFAGLFNFNTGVTLRFTVTAAFTATVTNSVIIKNVS